MIPAEIQKQKHPAKSLVERDFLLSSSPVAPILTKPAPVRRTLKILKMRGNVICNIMVQNGEEGRPILVVNSKGWKEKQHS